MNRLRKTSNMVTPRDTQRNKLYSAETCMRRSKKGAQRLETLTECQDYIDHVLGSKFWQKKLGYRRIRAKDGRGRRSACWCPTSRQVSLPIWSRCKWVVLHELAHALTDAIYGHKNVAWHGREFCGVYLKLVRAFLGTKDERMLAQSMMKTGCRIKEL